MTVTHLLFKIEKLFSLYPAGLTSVVLSSIERRYKFTSTMTGLIASTFDITVVLGIVPVSYFGGRGHKPIWVGVGAIIHGVGAIVFSLPHFVGGQYLPHIQSFGGAYCPSDGMSGPSCGDSPSWVCLLPRYFLLLMIVILQCSVQNVSSTYTRADSFDVN